MSRKPTTADRKSLIRLASVMPKGSPERKAILAGLSKSADNRKLLRLIGDADAAVKKALYNSEKGTPAHEDLSRAFDSIEKAGKSIVAGLRRASGPVSHQDLDILAGDILGYSYDGDGPESGISGLRYLAQDTGAIWKAAEEAGFESDDPALEHFLELSDNDRFRILKRNQRTR